MSLIFLKLGGSLITEKTRPYTPRTDKIADLVAQIAQSLSTDPSLQIVLGHGSGSFGHAAASRFDTRTGVQGKDAWSGFAEVWYQASRLNRLVVEALHTSGLPILTFSPAASILAHDGQVSTWELQPLRSALSKGLLPLIHGDVAFDDVRGGTILSTETLFIFLASRLKPERILLAGMEEGVWEDFPSRQHLIESITPAELDQRLGGLGASAGADVTGGMRSKVVEMLGLVESVPGLEVLIFSGEQPGSVRRALTGEKMGTRLHC